jgi:MerR family mercuric resistance operon transcriptional regulator
VYIGTGGRRMETLTSGNVARLSNVNKETLRFYERKGLIDEPDRNESGYRLYNHETVKRIKFIKNSQDMGFTLREIDELLSLKVENKIQCNEVRKKTEKKIALVNDKIKDLQRIRKALNHLASVCRKKDSTGDCPILEAFYQE